MAENSSPGYIESLASTRKKSKEHLRIDQLIPGEILENSGDSGIKLLLEKYYEFMNMNEFIYNVEDIYSDLILDNVATFRIRDEANDNNQFFTDETGLSSTLIVSSSNELLPRATTFVGNNTIVDTVLNTITLTSAQQLGMPVNALVQYSSSGTSIGGLQHNKVYYIISSFNGKIKISETKNGSSINLTSTPGGNHTLVGISREVEVNVSTANINITNGNELPGSLKRSESDIGKTFTVTGLDAFNGLSARLTTPITNWVGPGPSYILNSIEDAMDIDKNSNSAIDDSNKYLEMMQKEIAAAIPRNVSQVNLNKNTLYKRIVDFYKIRGSSDSIETFFRLLFNEPVVMEKPYDNTLIPSTSGWSQDTNQFINNRGFLSEKKIRVHDSYKYQKYSYLIKTGKNLSDWDNIFNRLVHPSGFIFFGEILMLLENTRAKLGDHYSSGAKSVTRDTKDPETGNVVTQAIRAYGTYNFLDKDFPRFTLSSMPGIQPGVIGIEDIPLLVKAIASVFGPQPEAHIFSPASLSPTIDSNGTITSVSIVQPGSGYTAGPSTAASTITIYGTNTTPAVITTSIDSDGKIQTVTIVNGGLGYDATTLTLGISAPIDASGNTSTQISKIDLNRLYNKKFRQRPELFLGPPQARDENDEPLATNVQATAEFSMEPAGLDYITLINRGTGYTTPPSITFSNPQTYYTKAPFFTEDFTGESIDNTGGQASGNWRIDGIEHSSTGVGAHTGAIEADPDDSNNTVLKIQTSALDTNAGSQTGGIYRALSWQAPEWTERTSGNVIRVKFKAKRPSSGGSAAVRVAYSTAQHGNSNWKIFYFSGTDQWEEFYFEYNISELVSTNEDYVGFQTDGSNGIVYIDDIEIGVKYDWPYAFTTLNSDGSVADARIEYPGGGYTSKPTININGNATAEGFLKPTEISSINIINHGHGYIREPDVRLGSAMDIEARVVDETIKLILSLNHAADGSTILYENSYYGAKGNSYYTSSKKFDMNQEIQQFGQQTIESNNINNINKYNINSYFK